MIFPGHAEGQSTPMWLPLALHFPAGWLGKFQWGDPTAMPSGCGNCCERCCQLPKVVQEETVQKSFQFPVSPSASELQTSVRLRGSFSLLFFLKSGDLGLQHFKESCQRHPATRQVWKVWEQHLYSGTANLPTERRSYKLKSGLPTLRMTGELVSCVFTLQLIKCRIFIH